MKDEKRSRTGLSVTVSTRPFCLLSKTNQRAELSSNIKIIVPSVSEVGLQNLWVAHTLMANYCQKEMRVEVRSPLVPYAGNYLHAPVHNCACSSKVKCCGCL